MEPPSIHAMWKVQGKAPCPRHVHSLDLLVNHTVFMHTRTPEWTLANRQGATSRVPSKARLPQWSGTGSAVGFMVVRTNWHKSRNLMAVPILSLVGVTGRSQEKNRKDMGTEDTRYMHQVIAPAMTLFEGSFAESPRCRGFKSLSKMLAYTAWTGFWVDRFQSS